ncbi:MAG TPA: amidase [Pseudonocardiaceae bacterium]|nr:amidase [Pseudonocardiaceae bacterium]
MSEPFSGVPLRVGPLRLAELLAAGEVSAVELARQALAGIEASQSTVNAFRLVRPTALAEAAQADRRLRAGDRMPLLGVPLAVKDDQDVAGEPTAFGCPGTFPPVATDSQVVRLLRSAGAIIVGKTNAPELGQWPFTEGSAFGATRNPWRLDHTPGGSSGGSAAAVAAGLVPVAIGSDGAGSIRIPAAWTHLVGIKPQRGRIGRSTGGVFGGVSTPGPLARTTADAALLLDVLAGRRPDLPDSFLAAAHRPPSRLRIAVSLRPPFTGYRPRLDPRLRAAVLDLGQVLAELGHEVVTAEPRYGLVGLNFLARSAGGLDAWATTLPDLGLLDARTRHNMASGRRLGRPLRGLVGPTAAWSERQVGQIFSRVDIVLAPTTATGPPMIGAWQDLSAGALNRAIISACPYAWPWNALGWPAINVPAGLTTDGLPIGAQLLGPAGTEALLIALAGQLEQRQRWPDRHPPTR